VEGRQNVRMDMFRLLFIGDVVGSEAVTAAQRLVPELRGELGLDAVILNGENSAPSGRGITAESGEALLSAVDFLTLGDHAFDQEDIGVFLDQERRVVRPANLREDLPGRGWGIFESSGVCVGVANVQGRVFMEAPHSPFEAAEQAVAELQNSGAEVILVDVHAEATSEKQAMGWHLAGRVAAVMGTHTHVPTADVHVLPGGTAYASDVGMTGGRDGIIGFNRDGFMRIFVGGEGISIGPAGGFGALDAVLIEIERGSGQAVSVERVFRRWDDSGKLQR
jgi:2',3'-cyclic-nucleotide 2'-phosphodiesterase